jgi:hypothetical protein
MCEMISVGRYRMEGEIRRLCSSMRDRSIRRRWLPMFCPDNSASKVKTKFWISFVSDSVGTWFVCSSADGIGDGMSQR